MKNKFAFTLAEVLITLAIIGVIAAITIPSIVANHQKRELETRFAKTYRTLSQAVNLAIAEHGGLENWDWKESGTYNHDERDAFVKKYFLPYLNVVKFCPAAQSDKTCMPEGNYKYLRGADHMSYTQDKQPQALLADGTSLRFLLMADCFALNDRCAVIYADINGHKKPNTVGLDGFAFNFYPQTGEFLPVGVNYDASYDSQTGSFKKYTKDELDTLCTRKSNGWHCCAKIILDGYKINY